jgi:transcriptional regulator with XRE-family HTH domain
MPIASPRHAHAPALVALGAAIRAARRERGVSQEELADRAKLDRSYMSSIERGQQNPGIVLILRVANALDMTATELFAEAEL